MTGSGKINAIVSSLARKRSKTVCTAFFISARFAMLASTAEGTSVPSGSSSIAKPSSETGPA